MKYDTATPYTASYVILRQNGKIAFVLRENTDWMSGYYTLPAGKIEKGESALTAAVREVKEEAGVEVDPEKLTLVLTGDRHDKLDWVDFIFEASDWRGEPFNAEPNVHAALDWLDPANLPENVVPSVKYYLEQIQQGARYAAYGWQAE